MTNQGRPKLFATLSGFSKQWGTGRAFQQDGFKKKLDSRTTKVGIIVLAIFLIITTLLAGDQEKKQIKSDISQANVTPGTAPVEIDKKDAQKTASGSDANNGNGTTHGKRPTKPREPQITLGPVIIMPTGFGSVPIGTFIKAKLVTGATNGPIKAEILEPIYANGEELIPIKSTAMGVGNSSEERLLVEFSKILLINGEGFKVKAHAYDIKDQILGLRGSKLSNKALQMAGGIGLGFLGGLSAGLQDQGQVAGVPVVQPSLKNAMLGGAATASIEESRQLLNGLKEQKTVIEVPAQTEFYLLIESVPSKERAE